MWFIKILKFPLWLLKSFIKKPKKKRTELEQKCQKHVRNFAPRHYSWQTSLGKKKKKRKYNPKPRPRVVKKADHCVATKKVNKPSTTMGIKN